MDNSSVARVEYEIEVGDKRLRLYAETSLDRLGVIHDLIREVESAAIKNADTPKAPE